MDIKPIKTEEDYETALKEIDVLFGAEPGTPEGDRLDVLIALVKYYEDEHHQVPRPDPIEAIEHYMDSHGLSRKDLVPYMGTRARVSEILNRKRPLTLNMIRALEHGLGIPSEILVQEYELDISAKEERARQELKIYQLELDFSSPNSETFSSDRAESGPQPAPIELEKISLKKDDVCDEFGPEEPIPIGNWPIVCRISQATTVYGERIY